MMRELRGLGRTADLGRMSPSRPQTPPSAAPVAAEIKTEPPKRGARVDSIAVLPLTNVNQDEELDYLSDGLTDSLINSLSLVPRLRVIARSTVFRYKGQPIDPIAVGQELGVQAVLTGRLSRRGDHLVVGAELVNVSEGTQLWGSQITRPASDVFTLQDDISREISEALEEVPTPRDPWSLMQHLPGVSSGRPNVGGSESTNQAQFAARGDNGANTMWNLDGVTITDMAAVGTSTTYYDFNVFEEVQFTTGGMDPRQQTGGLGINMVSKRGTSELRASSRVYFTNDDLQGENISSEQKTAGLSGNRIEQLAEYGGDVGGPLRADRLWFWGGMSRNDVRQQAINGYPDRGVINTAAARGDAQAGAATRFSFLYHRAEKLKWGRFAGADRPPETTQDQDGATHISKAEVSHVFGPALFLSGKFAYVDLGFGLTPQAGLDGQAWRDFAAQVWHGSQTYSRSDRAQYQTQLDGNWVRGAHNVKFGFQHRRTSVGRDRRVDRKRNLHHRQRRGRRPPAGRRVCQHHAPDGASRQKRAP